MAIRASHFEDEERAKGSKRVITSGGYSYTLEKDAGLALLPVEHGAPGTDLQLSILGEMRSARVICESPYDPAALRSRL
ncbi:hypothetical protein SLNSH_21645 [Alsobacter soli]|uniref:Aminomethyltransferase C-terminal domain-containing protein n=1 Tax=Alsobacter soli TaxID=2109933 RepID=A0A2T1HMU2_9HYPH|nr:glycine cleavage T C-terminal barrel domain-containing protein [Alsobacter soli]PSC02889.1 hypothetical protein SLNSH_21645 [Alsobacter soli]